jgi:hypothetical protein
MFKNVQIMHIFKNIMILKIRKTNDAADHIEELPCWADQQAQLTN